MTMTVDPAKDYAEKYTKHKMLMGQCVLPGCFNAGGVGDILCPWHRRIEQLQGQRDYMEEQRRLHRAAAYKAFKMRNKLDVELAILRRERPR